MDPSPNSALSLPPLRRWGAPRPNLPSPETNWKLLKREGETLWLEKPGQLQVHPSKPGDPCTLWDLLVRYFAWEWVTQEAQISILTRLDRETSGVVLVALSRQAARQWAKRLQAGALCKHYTALVHGWPKEDEFVVDAPLLARRLVDEGAPIGVEQVVHEQGKAARTQFLVLERFERVFAGKNYRLARLQVIPETGRMHQIRVHAAAAGYPLLGDKIYGQPASTYLEWIERGWTRELQRRLLIARQALHCQALGFEGEWVASSLQQGYFLDYVAG